MRLTEGEARTEERPDTEPAVVKAAEHPMLPVSVAHVCFVRVKRVQVK